MSPHRVHNASIFGMLTACALVIFAFLAQVRLSGIWSFSPDFLLSALFVFALTLSFWEVLLLSMFVAMLLCWPIWIGPETGFVLIVPLLFFFLRRHIFRFEGWINSIIAVVIGLFLFYAGTSFELMISHAALLLRDVGACVVFGGVLYILFEKYARRIYRS